MESTKQLATLISEHYKPGKKVLDFGCNVGHYLVEIRKHFSNLEYTGFDVSEKCIDIAKKHFRDDPNVRFEVKDIFKPIEEKFDIVFCCNTLLHLPDFRIPVTNLLNCTKDTCIIRTLFGKTTTIVKSSLSNEFDESGEPMKYHYLNTWDEAYFKNFVQNLGWQCNFVKDIFNPGNLETEYKNTKMNKTSHATHIIADKQVMDNIICNWVWAVITKVS